MADDTGDKFANTKKNFFAGKTSDKVAYGTTGEKTVSGGGLINMYNATGSTKGSTFMYANKQFEAMPQAAKLYDEGTIAQNIKDNMSTEEGSLGSVITELPEFDGGSFEYYAYQLDQHFGKLDFYDKIPAYIRSIALSYPSQVISKLLEITENTPTEFSSLDYDDFEKMYDELLELLKEYKELIYQAIRDDSVQDTSLLTEMLRNIEQLEFARSKENLLAIKLLYEAKKEELLKQFLLKEYVQKHPGIEHMGGVPKGGTFILVYYQEEEESKEKAASEQKDNSALKKIAEADKAALTKEDYKIIDEKNTKATKKSYSNSFFTNERKEALIDASYSDKQLQ
ncbi:MAG: hypothetical protein MI922_15540, partial [Bacteroidales bacterium]|nr:hypothetical protein [Bacteroidales bacterium]